MGKLIKIIAIIFLLETAILFTSHVPHATSYVYAEVPHLINYQGRLTNTDGAPLDGIHEVTFNIYDVETNGAPLWTEKHTGVDIEKGVLSVMLGSVTDLDLAFDKPYFLEIKVEDEVMSPRQRIASVGYAVRAETAERANIAVAAGDTETIKGKAIDTPAAGDDGKVLQYDHSNSKFSLFPFLKIKTGTYTGNGNDTQQISGIGFQPKMVLIGRKAGKYENPTNMYLKIDSMNPTYSVFMNGGQGGNNLAYLSQNDQGGNVMGAIVSMDTGGFSVWGKEPNGVGANVDTWVYWYVCFGE